MIAYLNVVADRSCRFAAAVVVSGSVGIVGWDAEAPICDTCTGNRRSCCHAKALAAHVVGSPSTRTHVLCRVGSGLAHV